MSDPGPEKTRLDRFLDNAEADRDAGYTPEKLHGQIAAVAEGLASHVKECTALRGDTHTRLVKLETRRPSSPSIPPVPPMRDPVQSSMDLEKFANVVVKSYKEGKILEDTTPEQKVLEVVQAEIERKKKEAELQALQAQAAADAEARKEQDKARAEAKKTRNKILLGGLVSAAFTLAVDLILRSVYWHG